MKRGHQLSQRRLALPGGAGKRQPWRKLVEAALIEAHRASGASFIAETAMRALSPLEQMRILRRDCRVGDFPVEGVAAAQIGDAFLKVVDAITGPEVPTERRADWAELMRVAAETVMRLLEDQQHVDAGRDWRAKLERD